MRSVREFPVGPSLLNLDLSANGSGTHWVAIYVGRDRAFMYYFDPIGAKFGGFPVALTDSFRGPLMYNETGYQPPKSYLCGYFALRAAQQWVRDQPLSPEAADQSIVRAFGARPSREAIVRALSVLRK